MDFGGGLIGGFGGGRGGGNVCDKCLDKGRGRQFEPVTECEFNLPIDGNVIGEQIVYQRTSFTSDTSRGNSQIFKMNADGSNPVNLSNNTNEEFRPDVNKAAQRIVFEREGAGLHVMEIDGSNLTAVPNTQNTGFAKWSHGSPNPFILFIDPCLEETPPPPSTSSPTGLNDCESRSRFPTSRSGPRMSC